MLSIRRGTDSRAAGDNPARAETRRNIVESIVPRGHARRTVPRVAYVLLKNITDRDSCVNALKL